MRSSTSVGCISEHLESVWPSTGAQLASLGDVQQGVTARELVDRSLEEAQDQTSRSLPIC
jgi:hypothetical protein